MSSKIIEQRDKLLAEARALADGTGNMTPDEEERFENLSVEIDTLNKRLRVFDAATRSGSTEPGEDRGAPHFMKRTNTDIDLRLASPAEARDAARSVLETEHKRQYAPIADDVAAMLDVDFGRRSVSSDGELIFDGAAVAKRFLATENDAYRSAFQKGLASTQPAWSPEEAQAISQFRAAEQSLTSASGGYGVPVTLDPTVIITSGAGVAPLLDVSRIERITSNVWKGVASAGVAFSAVAESSAISGSQATLSQPTITPEKAAVFVPYSFEIEGDYPGFANEMQRIIASAYIDYMAIETATGAAGMVGIFTAIDAVAGSEIAVTSDGLLQPADALKVFKALPERHRPRASWFMDISVESELRTGSDGYATQNLSSEGVGPLLGKKVLLSDYAPNFSGTTGAGNLAIVGDFSNFIVALRVGMNVELIPHVFDGNGVPKGQRGWLAWARQGSDSVNPDAFRLLQNQ